MGRMTKGCTTGALLVDLDGTVIQATGAVRSPESQRLLCTHLEADGAACGSSSILLSNVTHCLQILRGIDTQIVLMFASRTAVTPALPALLIGGVRSLTGKAPVWAPASIQAFSHSSLQGLPTSLWLAVLFIAVGAFVTKRTAQGRRFVAVASIRAPQVPRAYRRCATRSEPTCCRRCASRSPASCSLATSATPLTRRATTTCCQPLRPWWWAALPFTGGRDSVIASGVAALSMAQLGQLVLAQGAGSAVQLLAQPQALALALALAILLAATIRLLPPLLSSVSAKRR